MNIDDLKENFLEKDIFGEDDLSSKSKFSLNIIKEKRQMINSNSIAFADFFLYVFDKFNDNIHLITDEGFKKKLKEFGCSYLRELLEDYNGDIGKYIAQEKIKDFVKTNREKMNELIIIFDRVFLEEE